jgi:hypothetical protein
MAMRQMRDGRHYKEASVSKWHAFDIECAKSEAIFGRIFC